MYTVSILLFLFISTINTLIVYGNNDKLPSTFFLTGIIQIYAGSSAPPLPWLLCNGQAVSRIEYRRLYSVIGTSYGLGNNETTFNLPDFRGRFPLGVDKSSNANEVGLQGGMNSVQLTIEQLSSHTHDVGTLTTQTAGSHSHQYSDPGHDHGGKTGDGQFGGGGYRLGKDGNGNSYSQHSHSIARDWTHITIQPVDGHTHEIEGQTGGVGGGKPLSLLSPYQTVNYIIYSN